MAEFRVKNLMIDVVKADTQKLEPICRFPSNACLLTDACPRYTFIVCKGLTRCPGNTFVCPDRTLVCENYTVIDDGCGLNYSTCFRSDVFVLDIRKLVVNPDDIGVLREQLGTLVDALERQSVVVNKSMAPSTKAQAEVLEAELEKALKEVKAAKAKLK